MRGRSLVATGLAFVFVVAAYGFFATGGSLRFPPLTDSGESRYADLAAGFLNGHLYLAHDPDPHLASLADPWDEKSRAGIWYVWDQSYYNGRYYLYYSPLPALLFHIPYRLLFRAYPSDPLAAVFFSAWAVLGAVAFVHGARRLAVHRPLAPLPLWVLLIGLGNVICWALVEPRVYEVSVAAGMAMTSMWALAMLALSAAPTPGRAAHAALWLALAIAARPNLGVLLVVFAAAILMRGRTWKMLLAACAPLAIVATAMIAYNVARFSQPFEFGVRYQLTHSSMFDKRVCGVCNAAETGRLLNHALHYVFAAPVISSRFPFVDLPLAHLDPAVVWPTPGGATEAVGGIAPMIPLTIIGSVLGLLLVMGLDRGGLDRGELDRGERDAGSRAALQVLAGGWLVLGGVSTCWWVVSRYALDFTLLIVAGSIVCIEIAAVPLELAGIRIVPLRVIVVGLALFSIGIGCLLGFMGPGSAFKRLHPETFQRVAHWVQR